jgi:FMN phosphatase YigB (HAD superfamily)
MAYRAVLDTVGNAQSVWMLGDSIVADIAGAAAAGIPGILVRKHHADAIYQCDELSQVPAILRSELSPKRASVMIGRQTDWEY